MTDTDSTPVPDTPSLNNQPPLPLLTPIQRMHPVLFAFLSLGLVFFLYQVIGGGIAFLIGGARVTEDNVALVRWTTVAGQLIFILVPTLLLVRLRRPALLEFFRLRAPDYREIIAVIIAVFALQQMLVGYMALQDMIPLPTELRKFLDVIKKLYEDTYRLLLVANSPLGFVGVVVVAALVPAVAEELLFRGLVQRSFEEVAGGYRGALLAGLIFGAYHLIPTSIVPLAILGIFLGFVVVRTQNITVAMTAHFFNNFVACVAMYLHLDEDFIAVAPTGEATTTSLAANFALFAVVFLAACSYLVLITRPANSQIRTSR